MHYHRYCYRENRIVSRKEGRGGWWRSGGGDDGGGWRAAAPDTRLSRLQIRGETCTCSIGEYWAARQSYGGRPRERSCRAPSPNFRVCVLCSSRGLATRRKGARLIWNYNYGIRSSLIILMVNGFFFFFFFFGCFFTITFKSNLINLVDSIEI